MPNYGNLSLAFKGLPVPIIYNTDYINFGSLSLSFQGLPPIILSQNTVFSSSSSSSSSSSLSSSSSSSSSSSFSSSSSSSSSSSMSSSSTSVSSSSSSSASGFYLPWSDNFNDNSPNAFWTAFHTAGMSDYALAETNQQVEISNICGDTWGDQDNYSVAYLNLVNGDWEAVVYVSYFDAAQSWSKAGIMSKIDVEDNGLSLGYVVLFATGDAGVGTNGVVLEWDSNSDGFLDQDIETNTVMAPCYLKLKKEGTTFYGYYSTDGVTYTLVGSCTPSGVASAQDVGLFLCSNAGSWSDVHFDDFSIAVPSSSSSSSSSSSLSSSSTSTSSSSNSSSSTSTSSSSSSSSSNSSSSMSSSSSSKSSSSFSRSSSSRSSSSKSSSSKSSSSFSSSSSSSSRSSSSSSSSSQSSSSSSAYTSGVKVYTKGDRETLPTSDTNLEGAFSDSDYTAAVSYDFVSVTKSSVRNYAVYLFKDTYIGQTDFSITWKGRSNKAPSTSPIYLQIYNRSTGLWETLDSEVSLGANAEVTLSAVKEANSFTDLADYFNANFQIACRVYQQIL